MDCIIHVLLHIGERFKVGVKNPCRLGNRNRKSLTQSVCLHAICKAVRHHLRFRTLVVSDISCLHAEDASRSRCMNVFSCLKRGNKSWIIRKMCDTSQFDLVVVRHEQRPSRWRNEGCAEDPTFITTHGNVVQVWLITAQTASAGNSLIERRMNPAVCSNLTQQAFAIRRSELFNLAIAQERSDELRPLIMKFFEGRRICAVPSLSFLARSQAFVGVQNLTQLGWRIHIELTACDCSQGCGKCCGLLC